MWRPRTKGQAWSLRRPAPRGSKLTSSTAHNDGHGSGDHSEPRVRSPPFSALTFLLSAVGRHCSPLVSAAAATAGPLQATRAGAAGAAANRRVRQSVRWAARSAPWPLHLAFPIHPFLPASSLSLFSPSLLSL